MLGEAAPVAVVEGQRDTLALAESGGNGVGQPAPVLRRGCNSINQNKNVSSGANALFGAIFVQANDVPIDLCPHESRRAQLRGDCNVGAMRRCR